MTTEPVQGYYMRDPDGLEYFAVPVQCAGQFGENLQYRCQPDVPRGMWRRRRSWPPRYTDTRHG